MRGVIPGFSLVFMLVMILFWITIFIAIAAFVYRFVIGESKHMSNFSDSKALELLNERLVKGEISEDEYKKKKDIVCRK